MEQPEPSQVIEAAQPEDVQELIHQERSVFVQVRKTQYGKATFEVTFPDSTTQMAQIKVGERKDILRKDQKIGVRIEVQDSH